MHIIDLHLLILVILVATVMVVFFLILNWEKCLKVTIRTYQTSFLPNSSFTAPYILVGDDAFPLKSYLLKPYSGKLLQDNQNIFNYRLSRARRCIENGFGVSAAQWQIFYSPISFEVETAQFIVQAAVVLHNYLQSISSDVGDTSYLLERSLRSLEKKCGQIYKFYCM